jgi:hypothetical protein
MPDKNNPTKTPDAPATPPPAGEEETPRKRRRHGYRGYPVSKVSGGVHHGTGFSGVEPLGGGQGTLPRAGIHTEESTRRTK